MAKFPGWVKDNFIIWLAESVKLTDENQVILGEESSNFQLEPAYFLISAPR